MLLNYLKFTFFGGKISDFKNKKIKTYQFIGKP